MADKNYLDRGGLEHTWAKIKSWVNTQLAGKANLSHTHTYSQITDLSSWKTTNFGSGTINVDDASRINVNDMLQIHGFNPDTSKLTVSLRMSLGSSIVLGTNTLFQDTDNYCVLGIGKCNSSGNMFISNQLQMSKVVKYVAVGSNGVKHGSANVGGHSTTLISGVGDSDTPFIAVLAI